MRQVKVIDRYRYSEVLYVIVNTYSKPESNIKNIKI